MATQRVLRLAFIGWLTLGCRTNPPPPTTSSATASASIDSAVVPTPIVSTPAPSLASATPPGAAPRPHCKALAKGKLVAIGAYGGDITELATHGGFVFAAVQQGTRASVIRFSRDGEKPKELAHVMVSRSPASLRVDDHAAYFSAGPSLYSAPLGGGPMQKLAPAFSRPLAVSGGSLYGVRCAGKERRVDELLQLPRAGGEARVVGSWPRAAGIACDYRYVAVDGSRAFVSDFTGRRIIAISLADGTLSEIAVKRAFPQRIALEATSVAFQAAGGIYRVPKQGGEVVRVTEYGTTPFESVAWDDRDFYVLHTLAYATTDKLLRIPLAGGKPEQLEGFAVSGVTVGIRVDVAVDDECVYVAQNRKDYAEILARPKPR